MARLISLLVVVPLFARPAFADAVEERRVVIALFDSEGLEMENDADDPIHQVLEMPLNYLGMVVRRHDIRSGPPPAAWLDRARAVLTYFTEARPAPAWLWPWLETEVSRHELRVIHFGDFGPLGRPHGPAYDPARLTAWLDRFGLDFDDLYIEGPMGVKAALRSRALCALEADPRGAAIHHGPKPRAPNNSAWVTTTAVTEPGDRRVPVVTGPWGGIALDPWTIRMGGGDEGRRWYLDPFEFFREALGLERVPAPDPSMLNGRRLFFFHVDGDGFESLSTVQPGELCAKVMLERVFDRYELPFTVSIIVASLTPDIRIREPTPAMLLARRILNRKNIEPATHCVLHPLRWDKLPGPDAPPREYTWYPGLKNYEYTFVNEVTESVRFINTYLMEKGRRCRVMLWAGSCMPPREAIAACREVGVENLNGGVYRWDRWFDSVGFVAPWARLRGDEIQVHAGAANENVFDGFFDTMPRAYLHIGETIERTGKGRILKPVDIYVHFYSAERPQRLATLHKLIRYWAFEKETTPVFASFYCRAVRSAITGARILREPDGWTLRDFGDCRTVRLDREPRGVDFARSRGVLGARRLQGSLYVHLAAPDARIVLANDPPRRPHVEQANHPLGEARLTAGGLAFVSESLAARTVVVAGLAPGGALALVVDGEARPAQADGDGRLRIDLEKPGRSRVAVRVRTPPGAR